MHCNPTLLSVHFKSSIFLNSQSSEFGTSRKLGPHCSEFGTMISHPVCISEYTMQGNLFALLQAENESITWKSYMWDLPSGVLKFAVNSSIDTLPTFTNLKRWGKHASVNCQLCGNMVKQMLFHVLVHCKHTLDQGRLTWRHDSILNYIAVCLKSALVGKSTVELYCDLDGL
jgi:hypothetical protein